MNGLFKFAIVGCGKIASRHADAISKYGDLIAVCDVVKERAQALAQRFSCHNYGDLDEMLNKERSLDVVAICTPNGLHASQAIAIMNAGFHVLCEKPLALNSKDGQAMEAAATEKGKKIFLVKSSRHNPVIIALKELIDQHKLGLLYSFQINLFWNRGANYYNAEPWRGTLEMDGGLLFTQYSHYIDALLWLCGEVNECRGFSSNMANEGLIEFEDSGAVAVKMQNGMLGGINWSINAFERNMEVSFSLLTEKASIRLAGEYMNVLEYQHLQHGNDIENEVVKGNNDYGQYKGSMHHHDNVYKNLVDALKDSTRPFTTVSDGIKTVRTIEMIYAAVRQPNSAN